MTRRVPLPPELAGRSFSVADAHGLGVGRGQLANPQLQRPYRGVRVDGDVTTTEAYSPRLRPGDRFSHTTAGELWGAPLPPRFRGQVHVSAGAGLDRPRARGVIGHTQPGRLARRRGLPISDPVSTFIELATVLPVPDLVAVGDHLVLSPHVLDPHDVRPYIPYDELQTALAETSVRGVRPARRAFGLVRQGVESVRETHLRLLLAGAGFPEPECGFELTDQRGRWVGWFDLAWPDQRIIVEYDGDQHRTSTHQYERDISRYEKAVELNWQVVRVRQRGLTYPRETLARVTRAFERSQRR